MAEQGEATAIIRWEIFSNRPRMFKSIEKARKVLILLRKGVKKIDFFKEKVLNYGWVGVKSPKLVKM